MKKKTAKKARGIVAAIIVIVAIVALAVSAFLPSGITDDAFFETQGIDNIQFQSPNQKIGSETWCVYACLTSDDSNNTPQSQFVITAVRAQGILKNQYNVYAYAPQEEIWLTQPDYKYICAFPQYPVKSGSAYYGSVYFGIVPKDCTQVMINGTAAQLQHMEFELNGKTADFNLYYCLLNETEAQADNTEMIVTDASGEKWQVQSSDGAEYSTVTRI